MGRYAQKIIPVNTGTLFLSEATGNVLQVALFKPPILSVIFQTRCIAKRESHMAQFTVGLRDKPEPWRQYGEFNEAIGAYDFCPDKFIQPLKDHMIFQIQFQEMMAHTQLFLGYVEGLQLAHEKQNLSLSGPAAKLIARWVEFHWCAKYPRRNF